MSLSLWNAVVTIRDGVGRIGSQEVSASTVADQLEAGTAPAEIARNLGLTPRDFIAALAFDALGDEQDPVGPPLVQSPPRRPVLDVALSDAALAGLFPDAGRPARLALAAGLYQIFDHWEASHNAAQRPRISVKPKSPDIGTASPIVESLTRATPRTGSDALASIRFANPLPWP